MFTLPQMHFASTKVQSSVVSAFDCVARRKFCASRSRASSLSQTIFQAEAENLWNNLKSQYQAKQLREALKRRVLNQLCARKRLSLEKSAALFRAPQHRQPVT